MPLVANSATTKNQWLRGSASARVTPCLETGNQEDQWRVCRGHGPARHGSRKRTSAESDNGSSAHGSEGARARFPRAWPENPLSLSRQSICPKS